MVGATPIPGLPRIPQGMVECARLEVCLVALALGELTLTSHFQLWSLLKSTER
jgi:hypothetical protein